MARLHGRNRLSYLSKVAADAPSLNHPASALAAFRNSNHHRHLSPIAPAAPAVRSPVSPSPAIRHLNTALRHLNIIPPALAQLQRQRQR